uniref:Transposase n=1 Tax=Strongyloides papillosus TaxID=174720 RepID=A0A0N5BJ74_STREA
MKDKKIFTSEIKIVYFQEQSSGKIGESKIWGKSSNNVYWAYDLKRSLPGNKEEKGNIVIDIEDGVLKGFTVENVQVFLGALRNICGSNLIIADNLNV